MLHNKPQRAVNLNSMLLVKYTHRVICRPPPRPHSFFNTIAHYDNNNNNNNNNNKANIYTG